MNPKDPAKELREAGYPLLLIAVDGSEEIPLEDIYAGVGFYKSYLKEHKPQQLELACSHHCFNALKERSEMNFNKIIDDKISEDDKLGAKNQQLQDLTQLGKFYWTAGYIFASDILLDISAYYKKKGENFNADAEAYLKLSAIMYFRAKLLMNEDISVQLQTLAHGKDGLKECGYNSTEEAEDVVLDKLDTATRDNISLTESAKIKKMLEENPYLRLHPM